MTVFRRLADDLKKGANLDLYLSVVAAIILAVLNLFGKAKPELLSSLTLALLAAIAAGLLSARHAHGELLSTLTNPGGRVLLQVHPPEFLTWLVSSADTLLIGIHLQDYIQRNYSQLVDKLRQGHQIRVLLLPSEGHAHTMAAMRFAGARPERQEAARIESSLSTLALLQKEFPDALAVRTLDFLFSYNYYLFEPSTVNGIAVLDRYTFRVSGGGDKPRLIYRPADGQWFDLICREAEALWLAGTPRIVE